MRAARVLCFVFFFLCFSPFPVSSTSSAAELATLLDIQQQLGNPKWATSWNSSLSPCDWPEIRCTDGVVTGVLFREKNITGTIPPSICDLSKLTNLDLSFNYVSGDFPSALYNCFNLRYLDLSHNHLYGILPADIYRMSSSLRFIDLGANKFSGDIPPAIGLLSELQTLFLYRNYLSGQIPAAVGELQGLLNLDFSDNQFWGEIPPELGHLTKLTTLNLSANQLIGKIPDEFDNLAYQNSFLNNPNLCDNSPIPNLRTCAKNTHRDSYKAKILLLVVPVTLGALVLLLCVLAFRKYRIHQRTQTNCNSEPSVTLTSICIPSHQRRQSVISYYGLDFTKEELMKGLTDKNLIGSGGGGKVYRVPIFGGKLDVAVKSIWNNWSSDHRGSHHRISDRRFEKQFWAEVRTLSTIRHNNIVKLMSCIPTEDSKMLVYEYIENESLDGWLHGKKKMNEWSTQVALDWPMRLKIAVGAARGLSYMHHDCTPAIVHRDIKSSNILLDSEFKAKIADFGLAKILIKTDEPNTPSAVAGSLGYIAPEYWGTMKVDTKADVYSFGVVLLELVTGRKAIQKDGDGDQRTNLVEWAWDHYERGTSIADHVLDHDVMQPYYVEEMTTVFKLGITCTIKTPHGRPSMKSVLDILCQPSTSSTSVFSPELASQDIIDDDDTWLLFVGTSSV